ASFSSPLRSQMVPTPITCPISWVMTSFSVPSFCMACRSAVSNDMMPFTGRNLDLPALAGRMCVGPACPGVPRGPAMGGAWGGVLRQEQQVVDHLVVHAHAGQVAHDHAGPAVGRGLERVLLGGVEPAQE